MATQVIKLTDLRRPKNYLRGRVNAEYVRKLEADAREAMTTAEDRKTLHASKWPFPPLVVQKVEQAAKKEGETALIYYEIIDGVNRNEAAKSLYPKGDFGVPCIVKTYPTPAEAFADQIKLNNDARGLYLDRDARNKGIILLRDEYKLPVRRIAQLTGVSHASVLRIKKGTQGKGYTRAAMARPGKRKGKGKGRATARRKPPAWTVKTIIRQCEILSRDYDDHQPEIQEAIKKAGDRALTHKVGRPFAEFVRNLSE